MRQSIVKEASWERMRHSEHLKRHGIKLFNPNTGKFLHCSGKGETADEGFIWAGFKRQARKLRSSAGEWPYKAQVLVK